jgi:hypothetical protein
LRLQAIGEVHVCLANFRVSGSAHPQKDDGGLRKQRLNLREAPLRRQRQGQRPHALRCYGVFVTEPLFTDIQRGPGVALTQSGAENGERPLEVLPGRSGLFAGRIGERQIVADLAHENVTLPEATLEDPERASITLNPLDGTIPILQHSTDVRQYLSYVRMIGVPHPLVDRQSFLQTDQSHIGVPLGVQNGPDVGH